MFRMCLHVQYLAPNLETQQQLKRRRWADYISLVIHFTSSGSEILHKNNFKKIEINIINISQHTFQKH